jgi:L-amino acid N-acyltransferase YncA
VHKNLELKDGSKVVIREMTAEDLERSLVFFESLSAADRAYLRRDVTKREVVERRIAECDSGVAERLVAIVDGGIVADGALELSGEDWKQHVGELRLIVAGPHRRQGLGALMARELYRLAIGAKVEELVVKMMRPQTAAQSIFKRLGFREEAVLPDYVKDLEGKRHDLIVMRCDIDALWREMEDFLSTGDWQRAR